MVLACGSLAGNGDRSGDDAAVGSILTAVNTIKRYLAQRERGEPINREAEPRW
jgi:hypothetical protein